MTKYSPAFEISKEKAYEIIKTKADEILKHKAYNILPFMGFKPIISNKKNPFNQISKEKALQSQALMGFKPMTKYFPACQISKKTAYEILKERATGKSKEKAYNTLAFMGFKPIISNKKSTASNIKRERFTNSGFNGIQTHDKIFSSFQSNQGGKPIKY